MPYTEHQSYKDDNGMATGNVMKDSTNKRRFIVASKGREQFHFEQIGVSNDVDLPIVEDDDGNYLDDDNVDNVDNDNNDDNVDDDDHDHD
jgi:hypothetical protein